MNRLLITALFLGSLASAGRGQELDRWGKELDARGKEAAARMRGFAAAIEKAGGKATLDENITSDVFSVTTAGVFGREAPGEEYATLTILDYRDLAKAEEVYKEPFTGYFTTHGRKEPGADKLYTRVDLVNVGDTQAPGGMAMGEVLEGTVLYRIYCQKAAPSPDSDPESLRKAALEGYHRILGAVAGKK